MARAIINWEDARASRSAVRDALLRSGEKVAEGRMRCGALTGMLRRGARFGIL